MAIKRTTTTADAVLACVETLINDDDNNFYLEPYQNGREHGWSLSCLTNGMKQVAFSENRNSDQIVVYFGTVRDFQMAGNLPSDNVYDKAKYFSYDGHYKAAKFIVDYLRS